MIKRVFTILFISTLFIACETTEESLNDTQESMVISIDPMIVSRATEWNFESGDIAGIAVVMDDDQSIYADNSSLSYSSSLDIFVGSQLWYDMSSASSTLYAYYPYVNGESLPTTFKVLTDQSSESGYSASDLMMSSRSGVKPSRSSILMSFTHKLCRMLIAVDNRFDKEIAAIKMGETYLTASIDCIEQSVEVDNSGSTELITTLLYDEDSYKAIFVPQRAALSFTVVFDDGTTVTESRSSSSDYLAGYDYDAELLLLDGELRVTISEGIKGWEDGGSIELLDEPTIEEYDGYIIYDGERYNTITYDGLYDGGSITIMTENLRYIPSGKSVSSDATDKSGLWYPYKWELAEGADPNDYDELYDSVRTALTDDESIEKYGYFYNWATAFGVDAITADNKNSYEGAQGVCPRGWHIPTSYEWYLLCGDSQQYTSDITSAPFYDPSVFYGSVQRSLEMGFNHSFAGGIANDKYGWTIIDSDYTASQYVDESITSVSGLHSASYYMCSTATSNYWENSGAQVYVLYTNHASAYVAKGCLSVVLGYTNTQGHSIRCIKDR